MFILCVLFRAPPQDEEQQLVQDSPNDEQWQFVQDPPEDDQQEFIEEDCDENADEEVCVALILVLFKLRLKEF